MQKYIHVGNLQVLLRLVRDEALVDLEHVVEDLITQRGDEDLLLFVVCVQSEGREELPGRLVEEVAFDAQHSGGRSERWNPRGGEEVKKEGGEDVEKMVDESLPEVKEKSDILGRQ